METEANERWAKVLSFRPSKNLRERIEKLGQRRSRDDAKQVLHLVKIGLWIADMVGTDDVDLIAERLHVGQFHDPDHAPGVQVNADQAALYHSQIINIRHDTLTGAKHDKRQSKPKPR